MTVHIDDIPDYQCHACGKAYIPYYKDFPCPNCNAVSEEFFELIPQIVTSLKIHKRNYGRFTPGAWYEDSLVEKIQYYVFGVLDLAEGYKKEQPDMSEDELWEIVFKERDAKNNKYIIDIIKASYTLYNKQWSEEISEGDSQSI